MEHVCVKGLHTFKKTVTLLFILTAVFLLASVLPAKTGVAAGTTEITYVLDNCDTGMQALTSMESDTRNYVEGTGSLYSCNEAGRITLLFFDVDYAALPPYEDAYLEFYYYVEDARNIGGFNMGQIELTSSGYCDVMELNYDIGTQTRLLTGWNFISIKLTDMYNDGFDYSKLYGFRIYMLPVSGDFKCGLDELVLTNRSHAQEIGERGITVLSGEKPAIEQKKSQHVYKDYE